MHLSRRSPLPLPLESQSRSRVWLLFNLWRHSNYRHLHLGSAIAVFDTVAVRPLRILGEFLLHRALHLSPMQAKGLVIALEQEQE